jgi:hypothetical protein
VLNPEKTSHPSGCALVMSAGLWKALHFTKSTTSSAISIALSSVHIFRIRTATPDLRCTTRQMPRPEPSGLSATRCRPSPLRVRPLTVSLPSFVSISSRVLPCHFYGLAGPKRAFNAVLAPSTS